MFSSFQDLIKTSYPASINIGSGLSLNTTIINKPQIYKGFLNFPLDGTIFLTASGYVKSNFPSINLVNFSSTSDVHVNVNNQVFSALAH